MENINHTMVQTNGINMHVATLGMVGPVILLLHGFPELWYTWRHQMQYLSSKGYRTIAPDLRGYGETDAPPSLNSYTAYHIVGDLVGLIDNLGIDQVYLVGHDWGAVVAWQFSLLRPDRVKGLVALSVAFSPRNPKYSALVGLRAAYGDDFYICRFQEPGVIEKEFSEINTDQLLKAFLSNRSPNPPIIPNFKAIINPSSPLPSWLTQNDLTYYATTFNKTGFTGGLNYYRAINLTWEIGGPWTGAKVKVPVRFIVGDLDLSYHLKGVKEYVENGGLKRDVPLLEKVIVLPGVAHFLQEEAPDKVNPLILEFFTKL